MVAQLREKVNGRIMRAFDYHFDKRPAHDGENPYSTFADR